VLANARRAEDDTAPSLRARLTALALSSLLAIGVAEGVVRWSDDNGFPQLGIFETRADGRIALRPLAAQRVWRGGHTSYQVSTDDLGLRAPAPSPRERPEGAWLVLGDSQVFGLGVPWSDTFSARAAGQGLPLLNAGVPGYGVEDALAQGADLVPRLRPTGTVIVVNQANDWEEWGRPVGAHYREREGWLIEAADSSTWRGAFLGTPLARSHVLFYAMQFLGRVESGATDPATVHAASEPSVPTWMANPDRMRETTRSMAAAIGSFSQAHPELKVLVCYLPVDFATGAERARRSPFARRLAAGARPWQDRTLRDQLAGDIAASGLPFLDLSPPLENRPELFLDGDHHLSALGHAAVAEAIGSRLDRLSPAAVRGARRGRGETHS
jgi:lysophospholipase L1-like esterase